MALSRRQFVASSSLALTGLARGQAAESPNERVVVAIMGVNGRGTDLARSFTANPQSVVACVCDVDSRAIDKAKKAVVDRGGKEPKSVTDFRKILDDKSIDALIVAAPDHWHAPATILACSAGKHVYVEKPVSHNPREGELAVAASRKYQRIVQAGTQRRSMPGVIEAIQKLKSGAIGRVLFSRGWYNNGRVSIGHGKPAPTPDWLDWKLWQGPAPERPFRDNVVHYNWHWFWHWGTGECGNNGIHSLDVCRWGLGVDYPQRVTAGGGKYHFDDDQETPDTHVVTFDFGTTAITWEGRNWHRRGFEGSMFGIAFYGDNGTMLIDGANYRVLDPTGKEVDKGGGSGSDAPHIQNFLDCVKSGKRPAADIEDGHQSTLLCHLGNLAYRTGRTVKLDATTHQPVGDKEQQRLWSREYRNGWEPRVGL